jgi:hypothetical protein
MTVELGRGAQVQLAGMAKAAARGAVASSVEGNDLIKRTWNASATAIAADVAALTERVVGLEGQSAVPGPQGDVGPAGAASTVAGPAGPAGAVGAKGDTGQSTVGLVGPAGRDGKDGAAGAPGAASIVPGPIGPAGAIGPAGQSITGATGAVGAAGRDGILSIQRAVLTTAADGSVVWTFAPAFAAGVVPVISAVCAAGGVPHVVQVEAVTNQRATLHAFRADVLGKVATFNAAGGVPLHVSALPPT